MLIGLVMDRVGGNGGLLGVVRVMQAEHCKKSWPGASAGSIAACMSHVAALTADHLKVVVDISNKGVRF